LHRCIRNRNKKSCNMKQKDASLIPEEEKW
jgi:hypothetical protein